MKMRKGQEMSKSVITLGSLFDGIGGFPYAVSFYGIRSLWASEILLEAVSVTRRHFPDMEHFGDITKIHGGNLPPVDIVTFGSPYDGRKISDTKRYQMLGNSICVPCVAYIMQGIRDVWNDVD